MCGIAGIVRLDGGPVDSADIKRMTDVIAHRGPDGEGQWCEGPVGLGHRRLAIIDLSEEASQPLVSLDGRYVITYNGEVYNFRELRRELEKSGSRFRSHSDTEVVLEAVIRWGIDSAIKRFNGMFAFAIWDKQTQALLLGRDRYGIKPLYTWSTPGQVVFASEPKAIRTLPEFTPDLDAHAIAEYFVFQNILSDRTFLKGVRVFPPGSWGRVFVGQRPQEMQQHQYWDFDFREPDAPAPMADYVEEFRRLLTQAVDRQLVSDVEVGAYLSGGLDSGAIVSLAARRLPGMKTFTIGFDLHSASDDEHHFDERAAAETIASASGATPIEMIIGPQQAIACLDKLAYHLEEPRVGQSYPNYYAARLASPFVKVVLAGTGGDEILGGYPWRYPASASPGLGFTDWHFNLWNRVLTEAEMRTVLRSLAQDLADFNALEVYESVMDAAPSMSASSAPWTDLHRVLYFEAKTFLPGLLAVDDRLSMAHGIETRVPFLDNDLVDFTQQLPAPLRLQTVEDPASSQGVPQGFKRGKVLLRQAMSGQLPEEITMAPKQGFAAPDTRWFSEPLVSHVRAASDALGRRFDALGIDQLVGINGPGRPPSRAVSWSLLAVSSYFREFGSDARTDEVGTDRDN
jgi:asparagine synthase (glutamine-hydrolysing)